MKNTKLIAILSTFREKEWKEFEKITYPRFSKNQKLTTFFKFLRKEAPSFDEKRIKKEIVFQYVFDASLEYKDIKIRELISQLYKYVCDFLIHQENNFQDFYSDLSLLRQFRKRKLTKLFQLQEKQIAKKLTADSLVNIERYKRTFLVEKECFQHFDEQQIRAHEPHLQSKVNNLDYYYIATKLRESCEMLARQRVLNQEYKINFIDEIFSLISSSNTLAEQPSIAVYSAIYKLLKTEENEHQFDEAEFLIKDNCKNFSSEEQRYIYNHLLNYCIQQVNKGNQIYIKKLFSLQKHLLQTKLILQKSTLSHISYRNIVSIAIKLREFQWAENFVEEYKEYVLLAYRENAYTLSKANILYAQEKYNETIILLNQIEFTDVYYACSAKHLLCKSYFLLKEYETLEYFIIAFQLFLKRNKEISSTFKKSSDNFLKILKGLVQIESKQDFMSTKKIEHKTIRLEHKMIEFKTIANKAWLSEQIEILKSKL